MLVGQHQVVAAFGIQRHMLAGQGCGQLGRVGAAGNHHPAGAYFALTGLQANPGLTQLPARYLSFEKLHAALFGGFDQFADHAVGVDKVPCGREKQPALNLFVQLWRSLAHSLRFPKLHRHLLLAHAGLQCQECLPGLGALVHQQRTVFAHQARAINAFE